ncbi:MAG: TIGR00282 family metallophosphoesterase [Firmicutes bacterium]|nr:TIGR00282 family metallophosphoesterase [Bacillota bacterium]
MKILCIGDVTGRVGRNMLFNYVDEYRYSKGIDLVIANGENAAHGRGITRNTYNELIRAGCDVITLGNHTWDNCRQAVEIMRLEDRILRPANYSRSCPGEGALILTANNGAKVGVINLIGQTFMPAVNSPFEKADEEIEKLRQKTNIIIVDFHAEASSEKQAMGYYLDGRVSALFGTHTHVQTADSCVLPNGTGYITDAGMTGPIISVLGTDKDIIISRFLNGMPQKFEVAEGAGQFCGVIFDINEDNGLCVGTERIFIKE